MAAEQSFKNHTRIIPLFHYFVFGTLGLDFVMSVQALIVERSVGRAMHVLLSMALIVLTVYARVFALTAQDRVIRLEMRLRLRELLPAASHARIPEFTRGQLVALRFASDAELPELAMKVLSDKIEDKRTIKSMIRTWTPDHLRV